MGVNPVGEVIDETGAVLAGTLAPGDAPRYPHATMDEIRIWGEARTAAQVEDEPGADGAAGVPGSDRSSGVVPLTNTVIGCVVTDAKMTKPAICRAADRSEAGTPAASSSSGSPSTFSAARASPQMRISSIVAWG